MQRRLGAGVGKRLWLFLEPHPGFRLLRKRPTHEGAVLELTDEVYAQLGANCREIRRGIERIQQIDDRYVLLQFLAGQSGEPDCLRVICRCRHPAAEYTAAPAGLLG